MSLADTITLREAKMTFEQCVSALVAIVREKNSTFETVVPEVKAVVHMYLATSPGDRKAQRDRLALELGDRTRDDLTDPLVSRVQHYLVGIPTGV